MTQGKFELVFAGGTKQRYRRMHATLDAALETAGRVLNKMDEHDEPRAAHPAIIYGPGCGKDGMTIP